MRKLVVLLMVVALMSGICVAAFANNNYNHITTVNVYWTIYGWIHLWLPADQRNVDLGEIYFGVLDPATGALPLLERTGLSLTVRTNMARGVIVRVSAANTGGAFMAADLTRFYIQGGLLTPWNPMGPGVTRTIWAGTGPGTFTITGVGYQYRVTLADLPGEYAVTVTFTATAN